MKTRGIFSISVLDQELVMSPLETVRKSKVFRLPDMFHKYKQEDPFELDLILNITCINCQVLVNIEKIEEHSKFCVTIQDSIVLLDSTPQLDQISFKLEKLNLCLKEVLINPNLRPGDKNYILILLRLISSVTSMPNKPEIIKAKISLSSVSLTFRGSISIKVYIDRLQELLDSYLKIIEENQNNTDRNLEDLIKSKAEEIEILKKQTANYKHQSQVLTKIINSPVNKKTKIEEISSDICSLKSEFTLNVTTMQNVEEEPLPDSGNHEELDSNDLKKFFYSLCLSQKIKHHPGKHRKNVSVQRLYQEVQEKQIPAEEWFIYVSSQFNSPNEKFTEEPKRRRPQINRKKHEFESIVEVEEILSDMRIPNLN